MWINYSQHQQGNTFRGRNNSLLQETYIFFYYLIFCLSLSYFIIFVHIHKPMDFRRNICEIKQLKKSSYSSFLLPLHLCISIS